MDAEIGYSYNQRLIIRDEDSAENSRSKWSNLSGSARYRRRDLGVHENMLRQWVKEFGSDPVQRGYHDLGN
jgi:hypothetical protein